MSLNIKLSDFKIKQQILLGFLPVLLILIFLAWASHKNFNDLSKKFNDLQTINSERILLLEIKQDMLNLQRNTLVYSYVGYGGVLRKIGFLQDEIQQKLGTTRQLLVNEKGLLRRFNRMVGHYQDYKDGFLELISEKSELKKLKSEVLQPNFEKTYEIITNIGNELNDAKRYEEAYLSSEIERMLFKIDQNQKIFETAPDAILIDDTKSLIGEIETKTQQLKLMTPESGVELDLFLRLLNEYQQGIKSVTNINRTYLHLVNVVLAGRAVEIDRLAQELDDLTKQNFEEISKNLTRNIQTSKQNFILLSITAGVIGVFCALIIAIGIARPVREMALTFSKLTKGGTSIEIGGIGRKDEIGEMAVAANNFKKMAQQLEEKTDELEEFSYRTSHDLRSPLVSSIAVLTIAQESLQNKDITRAEQSVDMAHKSLQKLESLVQDILALSKTKNSEEENTQADVKEIIDEALEKFNHMDNFDRLEFDIRLKHSDEPVTKLSRLKLIIENLISNAIKYQDPDEENPFVQIITETLDGKMTISIEDNGLGIPKKHQADMFKMFKRFHPNASFGSGLGLYMMKKSADLIKGNLIYKNTGEGSKFTLIIPENLE